MVGAENFLYTRSTAIRKTLLGRSVVLFYILSRSVQAVLAVWVLTIVSGCASQEYRLLVRASPRLLASNPINKVAIFTEASVSRPQPGNAAEVLSLPESMLLAEDATPKIAAVFRAKGYDVVYAKPAAVGYVIYGPGEHWVYDYDPAQGKAVSRLARRGEAVYEYAGLTDTPALQTAVKAEFAAIKYAAEFARIFSYQPASEHIADIAAATGADTVCFLRLWGRRESRDLVARDQKTQSLVFVPTEARKLVPLNNSVFANIICGNATDHRVVWQRSATESADPLTGVILASGLTAAADAKNTGNNTPVNNQRFFAGLLALLPEKGGTLSEHCRFVDAIHSMISCPVDTAVDVQRLVEDQEAM